MSPVDFWMITRWETRSVPVEPEAVYGLPNPKKVLLVESQDEFDYCWAMQLVFGGELEIKIVEPNTPARNYLEPFARVYTTWDPSDPNRI